MVIRRAHKKSPNSAPIARAVRVSAIYDRKTAFYEFRLLCRIGAGLAMVLIIGLFQGCSCNWHLKQASKKCPSLVVRDTILVHDSILVDKITTDTIFRSQIGDTITITKDRLKIKYVNLPGDSVYIQGECDSIFVNRFIKVPYEKTIINNKRTWWQKLIDGMGITFFWLIVCTIVIVTIRGLTK